MTIQKEFSVTKTSNLPANIEDAQKARVRPPNTLDVNCPNGEDPVEQLARIMTGPRLASAIALSTISKPLLNLDEKLDLTATRLALREASDRLNADDLSDVKSMLYSQASALNLLFAEMTSKSFSNLKGNCFEAGKAYLGLALKAQNQCRMTLETLGNIVQPPAIFAKQANINNGGQQQVNNGVAFRAPATENQNPPTKLEGAMNETPMDTRTAGSVGNSNSQLATLDAIHRT